MTHRFGLRDAIIQKIHAVFACYPQVEKAVLYGSRANGRYRNGSDIDLTLFGGDDLSQQVLYRIMDDLDGLDLPYSFDLSVFHTIADPEVIGHINSAGAVFYERETHPTGKTLANGAGAPDSE